MALRIEVIKLLTNKISVPVIIYPLVGGQIYAEAWMTPSIKVLHIYAL